MDTREKRLLAKTNKHGPGGCWLWTGNTCKTKGYGRIWDGVGQGYAHRMSYELFCGPVPPGLLVLHSCDVRNCVNPAHLFVGTQKVNVEDRVSKGRSARPKGEANGAAKLTAADVLEIRRLRKTEPSLTKLARLFNVTRSNIHLIVTRKNWSHI